MKQSESKFGETPFFKSIYNRLHKENRNWLCILTGDTGSGKSYTALRIAEILDGGFSIDSVAFTGKEFINIVKNGKPDGSGGYIPLPRGSIIIFDEAGVGMSSRQWFTVQNQLLGYLLQTFRYKNYGVLFTVPDLSFIDIQARRLFHNYIKVHGVNYKEQKVETTIYILDHNDWLNKTYRHTVNAEEEHGKTFWCFAKPSVALAEAYEAKKGNYAVRLYEQAIDTMDQIEERKVPKGNRAVQMLREGKEPLEIADTLKMNISTVMRYQRDLREAENTLPLQIKGGTEHI